MRDYLEGCGQLLFQPSNQQYWKALPRGESCHVQGNPVLNSPGFSILFPFSRVHAELPRGMEQVDTQQRLLYPSLPLCAGM